MTVFAAIQLHELLGAAGFGLATVAAVSAGLALISTWQRAKVRHLATSRISSAQIANAIARAEDEQSELLLDVLKSAAADVAKNQGLEPSCVRASLYRISERRWSVYMNPAEGESASPLPSEEELEEWGLHRAASQRQVVVTARPPAGEGEPAQWALSLPVLEADYEPAWVMYLEGRGPDRTPDELHSAAALLLYYREVLELLLKTNASERWSRSRKS